MSTTTDAVRLGLAIRALPRWIDTIERLVRIESRFQLRAESMMRAGNLDDGLRLAVRSQFVREVRESAIDPVRWLNLIQP